MGRHLLYAPEAVFRRSNQPQGVAQLGVHFVADELRQFDGFRPVGGVAQVGIDGADGRGDLVVGQVNVGVGQPVGAAPEQAPVDGHRAGQAAGFIVGSGHAGADGKDDVQVVQGASAAFGAGFQVRQGLADDAGGVADQDEGAVGYLAGQFQGAGAGRGHQHGNARAAVAAGEVQAVGHSVVGYRFAGQQRPDFGDAAAHLAQSGGPAADGAGGGVAGADDEFGPARRDFGYRLGGAGQHRRDASEGVGYGGEQPQPAGGGGGQAHGYEGIPADHLAVQDAGAVKAGVLDLPDEGQQFGHWGRSGNAH